MPQAPLTNLVQRNQPFGRLRPRVLHVLEPEQIQPFIRIAHRVVNSLRNPLQISPRIILDHELVLFLRGRGRWEWENQTVEFGPNQVFFVKPFVPHAIAAAPGEVVEHIAIHFDMAPGTPAPASLEQRRQPYEVRFTHGIMIAAQYKLSPAHRILTELRALLHARQTPQPWANLAAANHLTRVLLELMALSTKTSRGGKTPGIPLVNRLRLERAVAFIRERLEQPLTVADMARAAGLSPAYFRRQFHQWTGYSPLEYLRRQRIEKARQLLADVDLSIKQVAAQVGFADPYHFSRSFHQIDGLSPSDFRQALLMERA